MMKKTTPKLPKHYYFESTTLPLGLRRIEGCRVNHENDYTGIPHRHRFSELVVVRSGSGVHLINGVPYPAAKGDVFVIREKTEHCFPDFSDLKLVNIMYSETLFSSIAGLLRRIPGFNLIFILTPGLRASKNCRGHCRLSSSCLAEVLEKIATLELLLAQKESGYEAASAILFLEIVLAISRDVRKAQEKNDAALRLGGLLTRLENHYQKDWSLEEMSRVAAMSPNNFLRVFRRATGESPLHYLALLRLRSARFLLRHTNSPISEIALECGFHDSNYFSKRFSAEYRVSPREYRRNFR